MMNSLKFDLNYGAEVYHLDISLARYTIVTGDSGVGKTFLCDRVIPDLVKSGKGRLNDYKGFTLSAPRSVSELLINLECKTSMLFFVDEDLALDFIKYSNKVRWNRDNHIVIFCRYNFSSLPFGIDDCREFVVLNECEREFSKLDYLDILYNDQGFFDQIICEDSKLGYHLCDDVFSYRL